MSQAQRLILFLRFHALYFTEDYPFSSISATASMTCPAISRSCVHKDGYVMVTRLLLLRRDGESDNIQSIDIASFNKL